MKKRNDPTSLAAAAQSRLAEVVEYLENASRRTLGDWQALAAFESTYSKAQREGREPMPLPLRLVGELRHVASAFEEAADYARSSAGRTDEEIRAERPKLGHDR